MFSRLSLYLNDLGIFFTWYSLILLYDLSIAAFTSLEIKLTELFISVFFISKSFGLIAILSNFLDSDASALSQSLIT